MTVKQHRQASKDQRSAKSNELGKLSAQTSLLSWFIVFWALSYPQASFPLVIQQECIVRHAGSALGHSWIVRPRGRPARANSLGSGQWTDRTGGQSAITFSNLAIRRESLSKHETFRSHWWTGSVWMRINCEALKAKISINLFKCTRIFQQIHFSIKLLSSSGEAMLFA